MLESTWGTSNQSEMVVAAVIDLFGQNAVRQTPMWRANKAEPKSVIALKNTRYHKGPWTPTPPGYGARPAC
jgi:hypothetical protein